MRQSFRRNRGGVAAGFEAPAGRKAPAPQPQARTGRHLALVPAPAAKAKVRPERTLVGVLALLACTALFPISDTAAKLLTTSMPPVEVAWLRYLVFLIMTAPALLRGRAMLATERPKLQFARALASALSTVIAIVSFGFLPVAETTAIGFLAPVLVTGMAFLFLGEKVGPRRWIAAVLGLVGVAIIVQPGSSTFQAASLIPLCGSLAGASSSILTRMAKDERPDTTLFYSAIIGFAILSMLVAFQWHTPTWQQVAIGGFVGFFATLASLMQVFAYRNASASLLQPFSYSQLIWAAALGYVAFGAVPGPAMFLGASIIAASGIYTAWREARRGTLV